MIASGTAGVLAKFLTAAQDCPTEERVVAFCHRRQRGGLTRSDTFLSFLCQYDFPRGGRWPGVANSTPVSIAVRATRCGQGLTGAISTTEASMKDDRTVFAPVRLQGSEAVGRLEAC